MRVLNKRAFSFSEILIALALLGGIAAILLPNFIDSTSQKQFDAINEANIFKMKQVINKMNLDKNFDSQNDLSVFKENEYENKLSNYLKEGSYKLYNMYHSDEVFPHSVKDEDGTPLKPCLGDPDYVFGTKGTSYVFNPFYDLSTLSNSTTLKALKFSNGSVVLYTYVNPGDMVYRTSVCKNPKTFDDVFEECFIGIFDANGQKPPNQVGKDIKLWHSATEQLGRGTLSNGVNLIMKDPYVPESYTGDWQGLQDFCSGLGGRVLTVDEVNSITEASDTYIADKRYWGEETDTDTAMVWRWSGEDEWSNNVLKTYSSGVGFCAEN